MPELLLTSVMRQAPEVLLPFAGHLPPMQVRTLGCTDYSACWRAMRTFTEIRDVRTPDELWLTEHPPVYTLGLSGRREHLLRDNGIAVVQTDRGGQVTYHGPGQLVLYTLIDLHRLRLGIRLLVCQLEAAVCAWLAVFGVDAYGKREAPGVYVQRDGKENKIAALGLKVRQGCIYHGLSVNIAMSLAPFDDINPCGYPQLAVTQLADFGIECDVFDAGRELALYVVDYLASVIRPDETRIAS